MLAEIHGKIWSSASNLHDRLEDQLTGDVIGALRYLKPNTLLWPFLRNAHFSKPGSGVNKLELNDPSLNGDVYFWPWLDGVEPDALFVLTENGKTRTVICIEAKLDSGLSGKDQLLRQMRGLLKCYEADRYILIYLTPGVVYPHENISWTRTRSEEENLHTVELYWLSWNDLLPVIETSINDMAKFSPEWFVMHDLKRLLDRKGFTRFSSIECPQIIAPHCFKCCFYKVPELANTQASYLHSFPCPPQDFLTPFNIGGS